MLDAVLQWIYGHPILALMLLYCKTRIAPETKRRQKEREEKKEIEEKRAETKKSDEIRETKIECV